MEFITEKKTLPNIFAASDAKLFLEISRAKQVERHFRRLHLKFVVFSIIGGMIYFLEQAAKR